ncbi:MAG TPA: flagellar basal body protein [Candidatus Binatia bacterium]|nr:flagellar basal body protein [Candidatus Binatia bacterium]
MRLSDPTGRILSGALDGLAARQEAIASNLANIDTPGYRPLVVDFEAELRAELERLRGTAPPVVPAPPTSGPSAAVGPARSDPRHLPGTSESAGTGVAPRPSVEAGRNDTNAVDLEAEVTALAETQLRYAAVSRLISLRLGMLRDVVGGR